VETIGCALPELELFRRQAIATPVVRSRGWVFPILGFEPVQFGLQDCTAGDHLALRRRPGAQLAAQRARVVVGVGFLSRKPLDDPFAADLPAQRSPPEDERSTRIVGQLDTFATVIVGIETEATLIVPRMRTIRADGRPVGVAVASVIAPYS
jgi:hypothetical protein